MSEERGGSILAGPGVMLLSAAIFGYFGFMTVFPELDADGDPIPLVVTLKWTLRMSAIAFLATGLLVLAKPLPANLLFGGLGLVSAVMLAIIGVWDLASPFASGIPPVLLFIFAVWNGLSSLSGLQAALRMRAPRDTFEPPM